MQGFSDFSAQRDAPAALLLFFAAFFALFCG
jgi:hypothetical protein